MIIFFHVISGYIVNSSMKKQYYNACAALYAKRLGQFQEEQFDAGDDKEEYDKLNF